MTTSKDQDHPSSPQSKESTYQQPQHNTNKQDHPQPHQDLAHPSSAKTTPAQSDKRKGKDPVEATTMPAKETDTLPLQLQTQTPPTCKNILTTQPREETKTPDKPSNLHLRETLTPPP